MSATDPGNPGPSLADAVGMLERGDALGAERVARGLRAAHPDDSEVVRLHGVALLMLERVDEARQALEEAVRLRPGDVGARSNLASALLAGGDTGAAIALMEQVVKDQPGDPGLRNNLANALRAAGDDARARDEYLAALAAAPGHQGVRLNLAATEMSLGMHAEAEARLRDMLAQRPHPQALLLLGHLLHRKQRYAEAQAVYEEAARLVPNDAEFRYQIGLMADEQHHYTEAVRHYRRALELNPNLRIAEGQLLFVLRRECDWAAAGPLSERVRRRAVDGSGKIDPFAFLAEDAGPAEQLACARARAASVMRDVATVSGNLHLQRTPRPRDATLRVGFVSAGFRTHATALLCMAVFEELGKLDGIELHLFAISPDDGGEARRRLQRAADHFHDLSLQPATAVAQRIAAAGIDVLVDVDGWCAGGMPGVFALRPAPVQASWLAYPGTSGAPFIDYLIADRFLVPDDARRYYSESLALLPRCYQPSDPTRVVPEAPPRAAFGLPDDAVVFASFNNSWKLDAASFSRMCAVLREVPGSVLWLLDAGREADTRLREAARVRGLDPHRLVFSPSLPHLQHLARYRHADLFLDTNPYNAHTTASDAIWAGCPVLTRPGETFASRVAGSLNHHLGMPELIARDDKAFIDTAIRFGNDRSVLDALHQRLAGQRDTSGLFDMRAYARDFAALLGAMDQMQKQGRPPSPITLSAP